MESREGFNLFSRYGRKYFFKRGIFGDRWARRYVLKDTFGRFVCAVLGHSKNTFRSVMDEDARNYRLICSRCFKLVDR